MEPALVDVNVHPAKKEVRFNNSAAVREAVIEILRCALTGRGMSSTPTTQASHTDAQRMSSGAAGGWSLEKGLTSSTPPISLRTLDRASSAKANGVASASGDVAVPQRMDKVASGNDGLSASVNYVRGVVGAAVVPDVPSPPIEESAELLNLAADGAPWKWCRVIGELRGSFILLETDSGCVTVDPCAALERIYYERLLAFDAEHPPVSQKLLIPESVKLSPVNAEHLRRNLDVLSELGFKIADFGNDYFMVEAMPSILGGGGCREILTNVAGDIAVEGRRRGSARWKEELIARAVSRTRAGSGFKFSSQAAEKLVAQLAECRMPYTCPQGKPTMIFTSFSELERKFGKKR